MKKIKFYNSKSDKLGKEINLDGDNYNDLEGTTEWFNYKVLTFIEKVEGGW